jgi:hypothetical protein
MPTTGVTSYRLNSLGFECQLGQDFPYPFRPALRPTQPLYNGYQVSFPGVKWPDHGIHHPPSSKGNDKERIEFELYPPLPVPSWHFMGCTTAMIY